MRPARNAGAGRPAAPSPERAAIMIVAQLTCALGTGREAPAVNWFHRDRRPGLSPHTCRVLPMTPAAVSVTSRDATKTLRTAATPSCRPTKGVSCTGNLFATMVSEPCAVSTSAAGARPRAAASLRPGQAQSVGQQPGRFLAGGQVNPRSRSLTDRGERLAASASSSWVSPRRRAAAAAARRNPAQPGPPRASSSPHRATPRQPAPGAAGPMRAHPPLITLDARAPTPIAIVTRLAAPPPGASAQAADRTGQGAAESCGSPVAAHVW